LEKWLSTGEASGVDPFGILIAEKIEAVIDEED
jgi:hypothetical protein